MCAWQAKQFSYIKSLKDIPHQPIKDSKMTGFGCLLTFEVDGGESSAFAVSNNLHLIDIQVILAITNYWLFTLKQPIPI